MKLWLLIVLVVLALLLVALILLISSRIFFSLSLNRKGSDDRIVLDIKALFGLIQYHYTLPSLVFRGFKRGLHVKLEETGIAPGPTAKEDETDIDKEDVSEWMEYGKRALRATRDLKPWTTDTLSHVRITALDWSTDFSLGDAAGTATAAGALWGLKWSLIGWASQRVQLMIKPRLFVVPVFEDKLQFNTKVECSGHISAGYLLYAALRLLGRVLKEEGGVSEWRQLIRSIRTRQRERKAA